MQPLDEMDLSLVLSRPGGFDGPPFPGESHIPALILGILKGCVIVLQYYFCEDTIPAPAVGLREETEEVS